MRSRVLAAVLALCIPLFAHAAAPTQLEAEVKAAYLLNFTRFVEWPPAAFATADAPITICILGHDPFGRTIDDLVQGQTAGNRSLAVRRLTQFPARQVCQLLFAEDPPADLPRASTEAGQGILTVGEGEAFAHVGGMIGFVMENHRVRFDINQTAARAASLLLSSRLMAVARKVEK